MTDTDRTAYTTGLRALADLIDTHPAIPLPHQGRGVDPLTFFIHDNLDAALPIRDAMTDPHTERNDSRAFPVQIVGTLGGLPALVYIHARASLARCVWCLEAREQRAITADRFWAKVDQR